MASVDCSLRGYTTCTSGIAKRQTEEDRHREQNTGLLIFAVIVVVCICLFVAGVITVRVCREPRKTPEENNDVELGVVPQRDNPEPTFPQPVANPGRLRSISPAPPPYRTSSVEGAKEDPAVDTVEHTEVKK